MSTEGAVDQVRRGVLCRDRRDRSAPAAARLGRVLRSAGRRAPPLRAVRRRAAGLLVVCALAGVCLGRPAWAQEFTVRRYTTADGLPADRVLALLQDARGYLWFGTSAGVARYDGAEFLVFDRRHGLTEEIVTALAVDAQGRLLAGTQRGTVERLEAAGFAPLVAPAMTAGPIRALAAAGDTLWALSRERLVRVRDGRVERLDLPERAVGAGLQDVRVDPGGRLWLAATDAVWSLDGGFERLPIPTPARARALLAAPGGEIWVATDRGVYRRAGGGFEQPAGVAAARPVGRGDVAGDGTLWFAARGGVVRVRAGAAETIDAGLAVPGGTVNALLVDHEGNAWLATDGGAVKLVASSFRRVTISQGLPDPYVQALAPDGHGGLWVATRGGLARVRRPGRAGAEVVTGLRGRRLTAVTPAGDTLWLGTGGTLLRLDAEGHGEPHLAAAGLPPIRALSADDSGVWIGTDEGLYRWRGGRGASPVPLGPFERPGVRDLALDAQGRLWVATVGHGLWATAGHGDFERVAGVPAEATVWDIDVAAGEGLWAATNGAGAVRIGRDGRAVHLGRAANGLVSDHVQQVLAEANGNAWLFTTRGLDRWDPRVGITHFDARHGLPPVAGTPAAAAFDGDGRPWFGTPEGLVGYEPGAAQPPPVPPRVVVTRALAGGEPATAEQLAALPYERGGVTFTYTALTFRHEAGTLFQYRLRGRSEEWSRLTPERRVSFVALPPGEYVFEVQAINDRGLWSEEPARVRFSIRPTFWRRTSVRAALVLLLALLVLELFRRRLRAIERDRRTLRAMVDQRTRELVEKNALLERMATTDELTGVPNRRFFLESLERELRKLTRVAAGQPLSVLVIDLDRFKSINDRYGHAAGDAVLRGVAQRLARGVRATDLAARYGGEEFAILLPGTDRAGARYLAEKLRAEIEGAEFLYDGRPLPVTISVGVATIEEVPRYEPTLGDDLLRRADQAMYRAKTGGRNRVEVDEAVPTLPSS